MTKNEEKNIVDCLESLKWCDEIVIIDDNSEDRTVEIAQKFGAKIFKHSLDDDFSKQRNFGLKKAKGDWILFIDADERIAEELKNEIENVISSQILLQQNLRGFYIRRTDILWGKKLKHGETGNIKLLRLAKKNFGKWEDKVHERWRVKGPVGELKNPLIHCPHQTISEYLTEINFYTDIRANELHKEGVRIYWMSIILYPAGKFMLNYFIKKGVLDGLPGLIVAILMSFHSFLVRGKLWFMNSKNE